MHDYSTRTTTAHARLQHMHDYSTRRNTAHAQLQFARRIRIRIRIRICVRIRIRIRIRMRFFSPDFFGRKYFPGNIFPEE